MSTPAALTPLIDQYEGVKARFPGHLILFRVGDFYETFGEDAKLLSRELDVVLTARAADGRGNRLPMAGVPHHAVEGYLGRLVQKGYKVALCDQVEDARFAKGLVRREVTRVVTPGTIVEDRILPGPQHNFLACVELFADEPGAFAAVDITTGDWVTGRARQRGIDGLVASISPLAPREILLAPGTPDSLAVPLAAAIQREFPSARIEERRDTGTTEILPPSLQAAIASHPEERAVNSCLAGYLDLTQPKLVPFLESLPYSASVLLGLDAKTLRHLEITSPMNPDDPRAPTLLSTWDATTSASGHRTLSFWLRNPLADIDEIARRQDVVEAFAQRSAELQSLRALMAKIPDLSRILARVVSRRLHPGELAVLRQGLLAAADVWSLLDRWSWNGPLESIAKRIDPLVELSELLADALPERETSAEDTGHRFRHGYAAELDLLKEAEEGGLRQLEELEAEEQASTGIRSLKIGFNQVFGYYFEISRSNLGKVPQHFRRKQTLSGGERFTSDRLGQIEERILQARDQLAARESKLWENFLTKIERWTIPVHRLSRALGELDVLASFAHLARERGYVRPVVDIGRELQIREGRHPVLDRTLPGRFVPNDTDLNADEYRLLILTGPNMSGKSTYMRQVGLLVVLAQVGAFVPAKYARIGVVDSLYTRMGFTDEIGRGKSSFMVEMTEVAEILRSSNERSLVLLDEVGRGTSTFDGLAIAWSTLRFLHDHVRCRTMLATHYYHLTELVETLPGARNAHLAVRDQEGEVAFLYLLVPGSTDRSYGLHVARQAGLPSEVLQEAQRVLRRLELQGVDFGKTRGGSRASSRYTQGVLLTAEPDDEALALVRALRDLDPNRLTPIDALAWIEERRRRLLADAPSDLP
jgi:DNA mismatch repair protein MutS